MNAVFDFLNAALPWIAMGILLALFFARTSRRKNDKHKKEDYGSEGTALGLCLGVALGTALHINVGIGMIVGMVLGLLIGSNIEKKDE